MYWGVEIAAGEFVLVRVVCRNAVDTKPSSDVRQRK